MVSIFSCAYLVIWMSSLEALTGILCLSVWVSPQNGQITEEGNIDIVTGEKEVHPPPLNTMQVNFPPFFLHTTFSTISVLTYNISSTYNFHLSFFFFLMSNDFIYFWLCRVFVATQAFLQLQCVGATLELQRVFLVAVASLAAEHRLQSNWLSTCGAQAQLLRGMWDLPGPRIEPVSLELAGGFFTTEPPGKPPTFVFLSDPYRNYLRSGLCCIWLHRFRRGSNLALRWMADDLPGQTLLRLLQKTDFLSCSRPAYCQNEYLPRIQGA